MGTIIQYPHYLFTEDAVAESVQDADGNWAECNKSCKFISMCRMETSGAGTEYQVAGGKFIRSSAVIQLPKTCPKVEPGQKIIIANDLDCTDIRISGICLNFDATQLHCRIWV